MQRYPVKMFGHPSTLVWAALMLATIASWALGADHDLIGSAQVATVGVLVIAFAKVAMVASSFMEVRQSPRIVKVLMHGWSLGVCALLVGLYLAL